MNGVNSNQNMNNILRFSEYMRFTLRVYKKIAILYFISIMTDQKITSERKVE